MSELETPTHTGEPSRPARIRWVLAVPFAVFLLPWLYAYQEPRIAGIPFFITAQVGLILVTAMATAFVYVVERRKPSAP